MIVDGFDHSKSIARLIQQNNITKVVAPPASGVPINLAGVMAAIGASATIVTISETSAKLRKYYLDQLHIGKAGTIKPGYATHTDSSINVAGVTREWLVDDITSKRERNICDLWSSKLYIIEDVQQSDIQLEALLSIWRYCAAQTNTFPRLALISSYSEPFDIRILNDIDGYVSIQPYVVETVKRDIQVHYHNDKFTPNRTKLYTVLADKIKSCHKQRITGDFLVFLPGDSEVYLTREILANKLKNQGNASIIALDNSNVKPAPLFNDNGKRKIILVPSYSESAVYSPHISVVFDSLLENVRVPSESNNIQTVNDYITWNHMLDRQHRTSQTIRGTYYPMGPEKLIRKLDNHRPVESLRLPIHNMVFRFLNIDIPPELFFDQQHVSTVIADAKRWKLVESGEGDHRLTDLGKFSINIPLSMRNTKFLAIWLSEELPAFPGIIISSIIDQYSPGLFRVPHPRKDEDKNDYNSRLKKHKDKRYKKFKGHSDLETAMNVIYTLFDDTQCLKNSTQLDDWAFRNHINFDRLNSTLELMDILTNILVQSGYPVPIGKFNVQTAINQAAPILADIFKDHLMVKMGHFYHQRTTNNRYSFNTRYSYSDITFDHPSHLVALVTKSFKSTKSNHTHKSIVLSMGIKKSDLDTLTLPAPASCAPITKEKPAFMVHEDPTNLARIIYSKHIELYKHTDPRKLPISPDHQQWLIENPHILQVFLKRTDPLPLIKTNRPFDSNYLYLRLPREQLGMADNISAPTTDINDLSTDQPTPLLSYHGRKKETKTTIFWDERRAFISSLQMLLLYHKYVNTVVYAGGAPASYLGILAHSFPKLTFHIYDPRPISAEHTRVIYKDQLFTEQSARDYADRSVMFISNIERITPDQGTTDNKYLTDDGTLDVMEYQKGLIHTMRPVIASLRFKLPYTSGHTEYFAGTLMLQPWGEATSTETRLILIRPPDDQPYPTRVYNHDWYSDVMFWHNNVQRVRIYDHQINGHGYDHCYDCSAEITILTDLVSNHYHATTDQLFRDTFNQIVEFINSTLIPTTVTIQRTFNISE